MNLKAGKAANGLPRRASATRGASGGREIVFGGHRERFMTDKGPLPVDQGRNA